MRLVLLAALFGLVPHRVRLAIVITACPPRTSLSSHKLHRQESGWRSPSAPVERAPSDHARSGSKGVVQSLSYHQPSIDNIQGPVLTYTVSRLECVIPYGSNHV
jgi:hypothetical protein